MCGRFTLHTEKELLARRFRVDLTSVEWAPRYNVAPTQPVLAVRERGAERDAEIMRWGLVPSWSRGPGTLPQMINARIETLTEKASYRDALARRRCLIPADGFYEWRAAGDRKARKTPFLVSRCDGEPFALAGLWERWRPRGAGEDTPWLLSCTIVTRDASPGLRWLHPRMPVILQPEAEDPWLDPALEADAGRLLSLLDPVRDAELRSHPIAPRVNDPDQDDAELIAPVEDPQPTLF
jgi:putative SOS response-associated peptidase YedK